MGRGHKWKNKVGTRLYFCWRNMRQRCCNPNWEGWKNYGGKEITVCKQWQNSYDEFYKWAKNSGYRNGLTIDRINNQKGYKPSNCRWVTKKEQLNNTSQNVRITHNGETLTIARWCKKLGLSAPRIYKRHSSHRAKTYEELFYPGHLYSLRVSKIKRKCLDCGCTESIKWRISLCNTCYARVFRKRNIK